MEIDAVVATTHAIDRGTYSVRITKEALEDGVSQINGSSATRMIVNHDPLCLPIGKAKAAWLREREDGEWELVNRFYIDDQAITLTIERAGGDGPLEELAIVQFPEDPRPFLSGAKGFDTDLAAGVEIVNFRDPHSFDAFRDDVVASNENVSVYTNGKRNEREASRTLVNQQDHDEQADALASIRFLGETIRNLEKVSPGLTAKFLSEHLRRLDSLPETQTIPTNFRLELHFEILVKAAGFDPRNP